ncbi:MAG TPA: hypothetical protein VGA04_17520 [Streptosporangiaceae bacterium]
MDRCHQARVRNALEPGKLVRAGPLAELTAGQGGLERVFLSLTATAGDSPRSGGERS